MKQPTVVSGPVPGSRMLDAYIGQIARFAYVWAWPMVNVHNRKVVYEKLPEPGLAGGVLPVAPPNHLSMLHDYIEPSERAVACPNQDVVYGQMVLNLAQEAVVLQVPDFGSRFWVYQIVDRRTDGFAEIGKMYRTKPGAYLLVGPDWNGEKPAGIVKVFRCPTQLGMVIPRVFMDDTPEDRQAIQPVINQIDAYPLSKFSGKMSMKDWQKSPSFPGDSGQEEVKWVLPEKFVDTLADVLDEVPPLAGEEAIYAQIRSVLAAVAENTEAKESFTQAVVAADNEIMAPLFQFRNYGLSLPDQWTSITNGAAFGTDYLTRAAVAKSNILVNKQNETKYFYQDLDSTGARLSGSKRYTVTFAEEALPPIKGFWSLTLYNEHHFFHPNELKRYSLGTKNKKLQFSDDGSLTLYVQTQPPAEVRRANWLPAPNGDFSLYLRTYWPEAAILEGKWTPPAVIQSP